MDAPTGMDPLQWARYDAAMQRYRDTVAAHRATFESELRRAKDALAELNRRHRANRTASGRRGQLERGRRVSAIQHRSAARGLG